MKTRPGLTLLELIIAVGISATMFVLLSQVTIDSLKIFRSERQRSDAADRANRIVATMVRHIRQSQPSPTGAYPIVAASDTSLTFFSSIGAPGVIQQVRYFLSGTDLRMGVIEPVGSPATYPSANETVSTVLANVRNGAQAIFTYHASSFTGSQAAMNPIVVNTIRYAEATILYDEDLSAPPSSTTIRLGITFRNLKDNY